MDTWRITVKAGFVKSYGTQEGDDGIKSGIIGALLGLFIGSNVWLWINLWNLENELFGFEKRIHELLEVLAKEIATNHAEDTTNDTTPKV